VRQDSSPPKHSEPRIETRCFSWVAFRGAKVICSIRGSPSDWGCESDLSDFLTVRQDSSPPKHSEPRIEIAVFRRLRFAGLKPPAGDVSRIDPTSMF